MIALLLLMAADAPEARERMMVRASARIVRAEAVSLESDGGEKAGRERNRVVRVDEKTGAREVLTLIEFQ